MGRKKKEIAKLYENGRYFDDIEEKALIDYKYCLENRNLIFEDKLKLPLKRMIESILRKYPINIGNFTTKEVENEAFAYLIENMIKFNENKITKNGLPAKAFSYCQTIVRNYFKGHSKKTYKEKKTILCYDDYHSDILKKDEYIVDENENNDNNHLVTKFLEEIIEKIKNVIETNVELKRNDIMVGDALINILKNWDSLFLEDTPLGNYQKKVTKKFTKNKFIFLIKEQTGLLTKDIRLSMKLFKDFYFIEKKLFINTHY